MTEMAGLRPAHFDWSVADGIATIRLTRPERKNPLTFDSYAELRDTFRALPYASDVDVVVLASNGGNFCSGGDVHEIIGPLTDMDMKGLLAFTRMTGDLVKAMLGCGKPVIAAVDGICVGAGAILAMASDLRLATPAGEDRLPVHPRRARRLRHGRLRHAAADHRPGPGGGTALHRPLDGRRGGAGLGLLERAARCRGAGGGGDGSGAADRGGPNFAHMMTKTQLNLEWSMGLEQAIEAEAQAQAICMQTQDFTRAYHAFVGEGETGLRGELKRAAGAARPPPPARGARPFGTPGHWEQGETWRTAAFWTGPSSRPAPRLGAGAGRVVRRQSAHDHSDVDEACRKLVADLGRGRLAEADRHRRRARRSTCACCA
jgi:enoyl-CoA hydratase/carnithine racemase